MAVVVTILWGDRVVSVERWAARRRGDGFELPAPFFRGESRPLLRLDKRGQVVVDGGVGPAVVLPPGGRLRVTFEGDALGAGAYRTRPGRSLEAVVEHLGSPPGSSRRAVAVRATSVLAPLLLFATLVAVAFAAPARSRGVADSLALDTWTTCDRRGELAPLLVFALPSWSETRPAEPNEVSCEWGCGGGTQSAEAEIGLRPPTGTCTAVERSHVVEAGETLTSIAHDYGLDDYRRLYDPDVNPELVERRPDPDRIYVGDVVFIPEAHGANVAIDCATS